MYTPRPPKLHFNTFLVVLVPAPEDVEVADFFFLVFFLTVEADEFVFWNDDVFVVVDAHLGKSLFSTSTFVDDDSVEDTTEAGVGGSWGCWLVEYDILAAEDILQFGIVQAASLGCQRLPNFGRGSNNGKMQPKTQ